MQDTLGERMMLNIADDNRDGSVDTADVVEPALVAASAFADTYLAAYLPITSVPGVLREAVIMIAAQNIRLVRDLGTDDSKLAYQNAVAWLKLVAAGTVTLPDGSGGTVEDPGEPDLEAGDRVWTRTHSRGVF